MRKKSMRSLTCSLALAGITVGVALVTTPAVYAATVNSPFKVTIQSGNLIGQEFFGDVTFDDTLLSSTNNVVLNSAQFDLKFTFLGKLFTEADDLFNSATAQITPTKQVIGLGYTVESLSNPNANFGFSPSSSSIGNQFFYEVFNSQGTAIDQGSGVLTAIPTPALLPGLLGFAAAAIRKRKQVA
jgi:hypothetical protein